MLQQTVATARVSAGFGATDPQKRVQMLMYGMEALLKIKPEFMQEVDGPEIAKEIFGALGYNDGKRFLPKMEDGQKEDPKVTELVQMVKQLQQVVDNKVVEQKGKVSIEQIKAESRRAESAMRREEFLVKLAQDRQLKLVDVAVKNKSTVAKIADDAGIARDANSINLLKELNKQRELSFKMTTGRDGI